LLSSASCRLFAAGSEENGLLKNRSSAFCLKSRGKSVSLDL
jgi:hypothetical protein